MIRYQFADDQPLTIKNAKQAVAQELGEALADISAAHEGRLKPEDVVTAARDQSNPLHRHFEWDDATAAESYRLEQARSVIRAVRVVSQGNEAPRRAFISIGDQNGRAYRTIGDVLASSDLQSRLIAQADRELIAFQKRFSSLTSLCAGIEELRARVLKPTKDEKDRPAA